jgi:hypothetical protein
VAKKNHKKPNNFNIPTPITNSGVSRYKVGPGSKPVGFYDNKKLTPVFSFDNISLKQSSLCYDHGKVPSSAYHRLFERLKILSSVTYDEMHSKGAYYRFHPVDLESEDVSVTKVQFKNAISLTPKDLPDTQVPTLFQFDVFHKIRAFGYLGYGGVFHLVWLDLDHTVYPRK